MEDGAISAELAQALKTVLSPKAWLVCQLSDFDKIPLVEEYL